MKRILIAGCGDIGVLLGRHYRGSGDDVYGLRRHIEKLPGHIKPVKADLADPASLSGLPDGVEVLFITLTADQFTEDAYRRTYVEGTRNLLHALRRQGQHPDRVVFVSSTSVYGQQDGEWVDEDAPTVPAGFSGRCMLEAERLILDGPFPGMVVRLGGIYGGNRRALLNRVANGEARLSPGASSHVNLNHIEDVAGSLVHLAGLDDPDSVILATDGHPPDHNELVRWIASQLGLPEPPLAESAEMVRRRDSNKRCRNQRVLASGYRFRFPDYRAGYAALIANVRA